MNRQGWYHIIQFWRLRNLPWLWNECLGHIFIAYDSFFLHLLLNNDSWKWWAIWRYHDQFFRQGRRVCLWYDSFQLIRKWWWLQHGYLVFRGRKIFLLFLCRNWGPIIENNRASLVLSIIVIFVAMFFLFISFKDELGIINVLFN